MEAKDIKVGDLVAVDSGATITGITKGVVEAVFGGIVILHEPGHPISSHMVDITRIHKEETE